ncbi:hypothetical protein GCM10010388_71820 [Streptomyces mauvecolor]
MRAEFAEYRQQVVRQTRVARLKVNDLHAGRVRLRPAPCRFTLPGTAGPDRARRNAVDDCGLVEDIYLRNTDDAQCSLVTGPAPRDSPDASPSPVDAQAAPPGPTRASRAHHTGPAPTRRLRRRLAPCVSALP